MKKRQNKKRGKEKVIAIKSRFIILTILAAVLSYIAYYLRFPNSFGIILGTIFLVLLLKNFKKINGVEVMIYLFIFNALLLPLAIFTLDIGLGYNIFFFVINLTLIALVVSGLKSLKKWGFYMTLLAIVLSAVSLLKAFPSYIPFLKDITIPLILSMANDLISFALMISMLVYIVKSYKYFR